MRNAALFPLCLVAIATVVASSSACNRRVFEKVKNTCETTLANDIDVPTEKAADILIVVDNSGSMLEEQQNLVRNFLNQNAAECPLQDLANIPEQFKNPARSLYTNGGPLAQCGFIQLLAAFENDFHVGVVTTDVGICDNFLPSNQGGAYCNANQSAPECPGDGSNQWGFRPQRGCLQPDGPLGGNKFLAASDLGDPSKSDLAGRFASTLKNIQTFGSPYERGLDAMVQFLKANNDDRAPGCDDDLTNFRRSDAALAIIFLTDEEDCSHGLGASDFPNENEGEVCAEFIAKVQGNAQPRQCYDDVDLLPPVSRYVDFLKGVDKKAKVAVIAGGLGESGSVEAGGCIVGGDGAPDGACFPSGGQSNITQGPTAPCRPDNPDLGGLPCCVADPGTRYYDFAAQWGASLTDSICNESFRATMLDIAGFIAAVDFVELADPPANDKAILVELIKAGTQDVQTIARLPDGSDCATETGWQLEGATRVVLCGDARPGPGDKVSVRARGASDPACAAE